jgi:hypothetical protein
MSKTELSKWWTTPSAQAAMRRAEEVRRERITKMKIAFAAKKARLQREVNEWKEVK